jgi:hypothetical protein
MGAPVVRPFQWSAVSVTSREAEKLSEVGCINIDFSRYLRNIEKCRYSGVARRRE